VVKALDRKLLRDLGHLRGQVITIALVVACGIASFVTLQSTFTSLQIAKTGFYRQYRFGDVFVHLERAPDAVAGRLEDIRGVARVHTRIVESITLPIPGGTQPPLAQIVSLPATADPPLDRLYLETGRMVEPGRSEEVVLLTAFAERRGLVAGDTLPAIINGERRTLRIVGLATSPEFVYPLPRGGSAGVDDERFAVLWMDRAVVAAAFQMEGAFNDAVMALQPGASEPAVLAEVDRLMDPYGGLPALGRDRQPSNDLLEEEIEQLSVWATIVPIIFLAVSAFLVNVVLARLVELQRPEIATLKALGYADGRIGLHYLQLVTIVVLLGALLGTGIGAWLGGGLTELYADIFRFPLARYRLTPGVAITGIAASFAAAALGATATARRIARLPPAEAMRPPSPAVYRPLLVDRLGLPWITPAWRIAVRELERRPLRTVLSSLGIATGLATVIVGQFSSDAFDYILDMQFSRVSREDLSVGFIEPVPTRAVRALGHLPGVHRAEAVRTLAARLEAGHRWREVPVYGLDPGAQLRRVVSRTDGRPVALPADGLLLTRTLADILGVRGGDTVTLKALEGGRRSYRVPVSSVVDELMGLQGYMQAGSLGTLLDEEPRATLALLAVDRKQETDIIRRLNEMPGVGSITSRPAVVALLRRQSGESMRVVSLVLTLFAATIAVGVVYNNARVAVSLRSRDLASLRVLGFTRGEISKILLGELGLQVLLAIPLGLALGTWLTSLVIGMMHPERYRFPLVLSARTYATAILVVLGASALSALLVRRRLDRLDLIGVLKTRE
jgi:putative ABC transport system permease protein